MNLYRYKTIQLFIISIIVVVFSVPFLLKYNFYKLKKAQSFERDLIVGNQELKKTERVSLYNLVEVIEEKELFNLEGINIKDDFKEVVLSCDKEINVIKKNLEDLKDRNLVKDIIEIDYNRNLWIITVIFNWIENNVRPSLKYKRKWQKLTIFIEYTRWNYINQ